MVFDKHRNRIGDQVVEGAPDLAIEVLSTGTASRDLGPKKALYERYGVPEYWIVDAAESRIQILSLVKSQYRAIALYQADQHVESPLLAGLRIPLSNVFRA